MTAFRQFTRLGDLLDVTPPGVSGFLKYNQQTGMFETVATVQADTVTATNLSAETLTPTGSVTNPPLTIQGSQGIQFAGGTGSLRLQVEASHTLAMRNGAFSHVFRVYATYTNATNFARFGISEASGNWTIGAERAGTGTNRGLILQADSSIFLKTNGTGHWEITNAGHIQPNQANAKNLGTAALPLGTVFAKEVNMADRITGTRYRLKIDSGILGIEPA